MSGSERNLQEARAAGEEDVILYGPLIDKEGIKKRDNLAVISLHFCVQDYLTCARYARHDLHARVHRGHHGHHDARLRVRHGPVKEPVMKRSQR